MTPAAPVPGLAGGRLGPVNLGQVASLQKTIGNRAVGALLAGGGSIGRPPMQRQPAVGGFPGTSAPVDDATALFGQSDLLKPPVGTRPASSMGYAEVKAEVGGLRRWMDKQTQSTPQDADVQTRLLALQTRLNELAAAAATKRDHKKAAASVPRPRSLDDSFDPATLSRDEAVAELDAIINYLRTSPPRAEQRKLAGARRILEEAFQTEAANRDELVRQRDILTALMPSGGNDFSQLNRILSTIEGIRADPDVSGQWLLYAGGMAIPLADPEVKSLRAEVMKQLTMAVTESSALIQNAYFAFEERRHKNNEHPIVHGLVKFSSGVDDLDELEIFGREQTGLALEHQAMSILRRGKFTLALAKAGALALAAEGLAKDVAEWESTLVSSAGRWVTALTILKEGLTLLATAGAAGLTTKLAKGVGYVRATLTVGGATTAAGALGAGGAATVSGLASDKGPSAKEILHATGVGAGTGLKIGATPGAVGGLRQAMGVEEGVLTASNLGKAVVAETIGTTAVNVGASQLTGESATAELKGSLVSAPIGAIGGTVVKNLAGESKAAATVGGVLVGAGGNAGSALAQDKSGSEIGVAALTGGIGGGLAPHLASAQAGGAPQETASSEERTTDVHAKFDVSDSQSGAAGPVSTPEESPFDLSDVPGPAGTEVPAAAGGRGEVSAPVGGGSEPPVAIVGTGETGTGETGTSQGTVGTGEESSASTGGTPATPRPAPVEERWLGRPAHADVPLKPGGPGMSVGRGAEFAPQPKGKFRAVGSPSSGISESVIVQDTQSGKKFLFKPLGGEQPVPYAEERGVTAGNIAPRAKAAELGAEALGVETPGVQLVEINGRKGSLTEWMEGTQTLAEWAKANPADFAALRQTPEYEAAMSSIHALDYLINNLDRVQNTNNYLIEFAPDGKFKALIPIDSELSFTSTQERAIVPQKTSGLPRTYPPELAARLQRLHDDPSAFTAQIEPLVGDRAIPGVVHRLDELYADAVARGFIAPGGSR